MFNISSSISITYLKTLFRQLKIESFFIEFAETYKIFDKLKIT